MYLKWLKSFFYRILCGFFLGVSIFAPGFSGSVVAIIMGIYYDLLRIISNPFKEFKKNAAFCFPLGIGAAISLILFLVVFKTLLETHEMATYLLFAGLIAGNIHVIIDELKKYEFKKSYLTGAVLACVFALALGFLGAETNNAAAGEITSSLFVWAASGLLVGISALIPGMSVSMILIGMGVYGQLVFMAKDMLNMRFNHILFAAVFGIFAVTGLALTARGIKFAFDRYPGVSNSGVFGFMGGSLAGIFARSIQMRQPASEWFAGVVMFALGISISILFVIVGKKMNVSVKQEEQI